MGRDLPRPRGAVRRHVAVEALRSRNRSLTPALGPRRRVGSARALVLHAGLDSRSRWCREPAASVGGSPLRSFPCKSCDDGSTVRVGTRQRSAPRITWSMFSLDCMSRSSSIRASCVTAVSRIRGTHGTQEDTGGHEEDSVQVREEPSGHYRTREDTAIARFGTVRPRVQIPGPRPFFEFKTRFSRPTRWRFWPWGSLGGHGTAEPLEASPVELSWRHSSPLPSHPNEMPIRDHEAQGQPPGFTPGFRGACPRLQATELTPG